MKWKSKCCKDKHEKLNDIIGAGLDVIVIEMYTNLYIQKGKWIKQITFTTHYAFN